MTPQKANYPLGALAYIKRFWFDTALSGHKVPLDALRGFADPSRILFGTDYPYVSEDVAISETAGLDAYAGFWERRGAFWEVEGQGVILRPVNMADTGRHLCKITRCS
jgi:hypothetical protein